MFLYILIADLSAFNICAQERDRESQHYLYSLINQIGFVRRIPVRPSGVIFSAEGEMDMLSNGDRVYIRETGEAPLIVGRTYMIYVTPEPIKDRRTDTYVGTQHHLTGLVEIVEKEPRFTVAKIVQSFRDITINSFLMPYTRRSTEITLTESVEGLDGEIIAPEDSNITIMGQDSIVFINKGKRHGVAPGQQYSIYERHTAVPDPRAKEKIHLSAVDFGKLIVLHVEEDISTAVITRSEKTVLVGSKIRSPIR
ncbi:hypothetical protein QUF80_12810 [Desulfococcaceae bacterium HSG8]|nr:hypothetical protein [Desulfococcaceae bacterium HSG8]